MHCLTDRLTALSLLLVLLPLQSTPSPCCCSFALVPCIFFSLPSSLFPHPVPSNRSLPLGGWLTQHVTRRSPLDWLLDLNGPRWTFVRTIKPRSTLHTGLHFCLSLCRCLDIIAATTSGLQARYFPSNRGQRAIPDAYVYGEYGVPTCKHCPRI